MNFQVNISGRLSSRLFNTTFARLMLTALFIISFLARLAGEPPENVGLLSRLDFAPGLLEIVSEELEEKTGQHFSLTIQPLENFSASSSADVNRLMLVEEGVDPGLLPAGSEKTGIFVRLIWVIAANKEVKAMIGSQPLTLERFADLLADLRKSDPERFPWFESLLSRNTMRNLCLLLGEKTSGKARKQPRKDSFAHQPHAAAVLYRAIEAELLNPLSVEADLSMAMEVFAAGDAVFVSHWVPESYLANERLDGGQNHNLADEAILMPFPVKDGAETMPAMTLHLWKTAEAPLPIQTTTGRRMASSFPTPFELNYASETAWIEKKFAENYDALIVGDL